MFVRGNPHDIKVWQREAKRWKLRAERAERKLAKGEARIRKLKEPSIKALKKRAWAECSRYVRLRDRVQMADDGGEIQLVGVCFTCGKKDDWKKMQGGHFQEASVCGAENYCAEENVHSQCVACNFYKHGNQKVYHAKMLEKYGPEVVDRLMNHRNEFKPTKEFWIQEREKFRAKAEKLLVEEAALKNPAGDILEAL